MARAEGRIRSKVDKFHAKLIHDTARNPGVCGSSFLFLSENDPAIDPASQMSVSNAGSNSLSEYSQGTAR